MSALPDYPQALNMALSGVQPLEYFETVDLRDGLLRVLVEPVTADRDLPPFNRAQMDGYALRAREFAANRSWRVAHVIAAGRSPGVRVPPGECVAIATGAALPDDVDAVIQHELSDRGDQRGGPVRFTIDKVAQWNAVHRRGADAKAGDILIRPRTTLQPHHLGLAAAAGVTRLTVAARPRVAIITSGDEILAPETSSAHLMPHQIRNSNQVMVAALVERMAATTSFTQHVPDEPQATAHAVGEAITRADLLITIGGVSAGDRDHFPHAFAQLKVKTLLQGASIQPGRPIYVGRAPSGAIVVGLPGNPVSALACSCLFAWPIIRVMLGVDAALEWRDVELALPVKPNPARRAFRPAILSKDGAMVPNWAGSGDLAHTAKTQGLLELPVQPDPVIAGTRLRFLSWP
jgi:molybdopterin molybdotransferase